MRKPSSVAKPSALTYELMVIGHADISKELRRIEAGFLPCTRHDAETLRRMLASIESMMKECRTQRLH